MADITLTTPYATAVAYVAGEIPSWMDEYNAQRLASYDLYDDLYDNVPSVNMALLRAQEDRPIFIPSALRMVNTLCRYVGKGWGYVVEPETGTPQQQELVKLTLGGLFRRERIMSQFNTGKAELLRRGDWVWMIAADPDKPAGKRITITTVDPRTYFPIHDDTDVRRLSGAQIVEETMLADGQTLALKIQTWLKPNHPDHPSFGQPVPELGHPIAYQEEILEIADWQNPEKRSVLQTPEPLAELPGIYSIPLYHIKVRTGETDPFGKSILSGMESVLMGVNQAITDEDLSIALTGVGMFETTSGAPVDPNTGAPGAWQFGPGVVVEHAPNTVFNRLKGIDDVKVFQDHLAYLSEALYGTYGINDIAMGRSGSAAESGVALAIKMQPLFDEADDIDQAINDKWSQLLYDLIQMWLPTYEQVYAQEVTVYSECDNGSRLPFDRAQRWKELVEGYAAGFFTLKFVHKVMVEELGYEISEEEAGAVLDEAAARADAADPYSGRVRAELS